METPKVNLEIAKEHGLSEDEYKDVISILGRTPTYTELGIFSVMWSEHCSYKSSIAELKKLPREGEQILAGAGEENAGLVDIGDGLAVAFKIESHNHPSAIEPYQGAATGVGGILRDVFTMGARPIASLNSLRFGSLEKPRNAYLLDGVVRGIGDYGNCIGVPTVAGEIYFDESYDGNPLVNAMTVGIVEKRNTMSAVARGEKNSVLLLGSSTGKDGIHGATFASEELSEQSEERRPAVQIGDPFREKVLLEATLELAKTDALVGIQDMGAAGIICSTSETSAKGEAGMKIDLSKVPQREPGMTPYEILLSESQERMLLIVRRGREEEVYRIAGKWDLNCVKIGEVASGTDLTFDLDGERYANVPAYSLVLGGGAPVYHRDAKKPSYLEKVRELDEKDLAEPDDLERTFFELLTSPNIASKRWVYRQYDSTIGSNTVIGPGADAAVMRIKGSSKGLALKTDGNGRYTYLNPRRGGMISVAESARNVICTGAKPIAVTNCLNFGNPEDPEVFWTFKETVRGMGDACRAFATPVTGGNVSFYNESPAGAVYPTPVVGMLGLLEDLSHATDSGFKSEGDVVIMLGDFKPQLGGSEYLNRVYGRVAGDAPQLDLDYEKKLHTVCLDGIKAGLVKSAHDLSDGGAAIALAECCISSKDRLGATIEIKGEMRTDILYFGESQSVILISVDEADLVAMQEIAGKYGVRCEVIGSVGGSNLKLKNCLNITVERMEDEYESALPNLMERTKR